MSYAQYLEKLLKPLRIYDEEGVFHQGELACVGEVLDDIFETLEEMEREMLLITASDYGVEQMAELFSMKPASRDNETLATALSYLLRIGGDSFTVEDINETVSGCGVWARVEETETYGTVGVMFPEVVGVPEGFATICEIIAMILPAHLAVEYTFWYITWTHLESRIPDFADLDARNLSWIELEELVY